ncbi:MULTISPECIES: relaxase domain-containing protein [unclassified Frankia]|uniref:relaxase domain-containing protein n=1 Tax=unclassified Frankia TaxID=2632575 RepID=UPI002AD4D65C|nr:MULTISPECIES: relaxase domain-containing protein [unclassified Frankia]
MVIATVKVLGLRARDFAGVAAAARRVVDYVQGTPSAPETASQGPAGYYNEGTARGRARGSGAGLLGLRGEVDAVHLQRLLCGLHARTGLPVLPAAGSAGRATAGTPTTARSGQACEVLSLRQAAAIAGVGVTYLRRLAERTAAADTAAADHGDTPSAADSATATDPAATTTPATERPGGGERLTARKEPGSGRWLVTRTEVDRFTAEREPPTVVLGFDVTCAAPKSVSLLWAFGDDALRADIAAALDAGVDAVIGYLERYATVGKVDGRNRPGRWR